MSYLRASIAGKSVVPQTLVRAGDGLLIVVIMGGGCCCQRSEGCDEVQHGAVLLRDETP